MIRKFIDRFNDKKHILEEKYNKEHPQSYKEIVKDVISIISEDDYSDPNPELITELDHGHYQGTLLYVIPSSAYQPSDYWYVMVSYGSCSCCDTLQGIHDMSDEALPTEEQVKDYMTLALHILQCLRKMYPSKDE